MLLLLVLFGPDCPLLCDARVLQLDLPVEFAVDLAFCAGSCVICSVSSLASDCIVHGFLQFGGQMWRKLHYRVGALRVWLLVWRWCSRGAVVAAVPVLLLPVAWGVRLNCARDCRSHMPTSSVTKEYPRVSRVTKEFPRVSSVTEEYPRVSSVTKEYPRCYNCGHLC